MSPLQEEMGKAECNKDDGLWKYNLFLPYLSDQQKSFWKANTQYYH